MGKRIEIIVKTTDACNARCVYCSAGSDPGGRRELSGEAAGLLLRQADELIAAGRVDRVRFLWHGGEPLLLGKDFFRELAVAFHALPHRAGITHRIQTNLTLLDEEWISILEPLIGRDGLGTSLDPFDDVRQLGEAGGYRRRWLAGLELLDRAGWKAGCVYVLHRPGLPRAKDLYWFFRNLRDNSMLSLRVNPLLRVGRAKETPCESLLLTPGDYGRFLIEIADVWLGDHRRLILSPVWDFVRAWEGGSVSSCDLAGRAGCVEGHLGIDADGFVYNCGRAVDAGGMKLGRLGEASLQECLDHPWRQVLVDREKALRRGSCGVCEYWRFCHGGCPYESHAESEHAHRPTLLCGDYRLFFEWLAGKAGDQRSTVGGRPSAISGRLSATGDQRSSVSGQQEYAVVVPGAGGGIAGVRSATSCGKPVFLADLRAWLPYDLRSLAELFLRDPGLNVAIEPFYSALVRLTGGAAAGGCRSLRQMYREASPIRCPDLHCATCEAFKFCRGFWLDPQPLDEHCRAWREVHAMMARLVA